MHRWAQWRQLTSALGLPEEGTALALNATSRALLIFLQVPAKAGSTHAIMQARSDQLLSCTARLYRLLCFGLLPACEYVAGMQQ